MITCFSNRRARGEDIALLIEHRKRHTADASSIPRCGNGFLSQSQLSVQTLFRCPHPPVRNRNAITSVRTIKILKSMSESVDYGNTKNTQHGYTEGWIARLCRSWLSPGKSNRNFSWEKSLWDNTGV